MTDPHLSDDDLRRRVRAAVDDVEPASGLDRIRTRTRGSAMTSRRPWLLTAVGAVAATAATIVAVTLVNTQGPDGGTDGAPAAGGDDRSALDEPDDADWTMTWPADPSASGEARPDEPSATPDGSGKASLESSGDATAKPEGELHRAAVPVYYVGDTPTGPRLFREFVADPAPTGGEAGRLLSALELSISGTAHDPDFRSGWPGGGSPDGYTVTGAGLTGSPGQIQVNLRFDGGDLAVRPPGMSARAARMAIQQLVHTAQAVVQARIPVLFTADRGRPLSELLGVDVTRPVRDDVALRVEAPVWIIDPQEGAVVGRRFAVTGRGAFFEGTVSWQLLRDDRVVDDGFGTAEECCVLSPYTFKVRGAAPGDYVLRVYAADAGDGAGVPEDTKRITVR